MTLVGISILFKSVHPENAFSRILSSSLGIVTTPSTGVIAHTATASLALRSIVRRIEEISAVIGMPMLAIFPIHHSRKLAFLPIQLTYALTTQYRRIVRRVLELPGPNEIITTAFTLSSQLVTQKAVKMQIVCPL
jgi:hypothetical protein